MNILISVAKRVAASPSDAVIVCGNSGYTLTFDFDDEWSAEKTKIARFVWFSKNKPYSEEIPFEGDTVAVPVLSNTNAVYAGVYAGNLRTTTPAKIVCEPSILCYGQDASMNPGEMALMKGQIAELFKKVSEEETDPTVPEWAKSDKKPTYTAAEVGAVASSELSSAVNDALAKAKASGEFDGRDGEDYVLNEADRAKIAEQAAALVEVPEISGNGVDVTAKPGQMIRVKSVDENGKPTAWEAVPWGYTEGGMVEILPETTMTPDYDETIAPTFFVEGDQTITVKWNGTEYECQTYWVSMDAENDSIMFGNSEVLANFGTTVEANELPFAAIVKADGSLSGMIALDGSTEVTVSIKAESETIHKLPGKLLPEGVPYVEKGLVEILPETDAVEAEDPNFGKCWSINKAPNLTAGETYTVIYNGVQYDCVCHSGDDSGLSWAKGAFLMGNHSVIGGTDTGEPFAMVIFPAHQMIVCLDLTSATSVRIGIMGEGETIHKIDPRCLPDDFPGSGGNVDLTGYAKEQWVQQNYQPKGEYLTEVPEGYAKTDDIPTKPEDIDAQPKGDYALKSEIPSVPVQSVNNKTGAVKLSASDVGARPDNWIPSAQEVGALPSTYTPPNQTAEQVGADPKGTAASAVSQHNAAEDSHNDIRLELKAINERLTAFFDSDNQTLDELSEIVAYITSNKSLIDAITITKVNIADIINNLTSNVANKPLSAAQGVVLKGLIDAVSKSLASYALKSEIPTKASQLQNDSGYLTKHQDISGLLPRTELPAAIDTALEQAKNSGEFDGKNGTSVTVKKVTESTEDGGSNVVEFSDGKTIVIKNGRNGNSGYTPQKNVDYWTPADQEAIVQQVITALGTPVFGRVDAENNIILTGALADGTYTFQYEDEEGNTHPLGTYTKEPEQTYTNLFDPAAATLNARMSATSGEPKAHDGYTMSASIMLPTSVNVTSGFDENTPYIAVPAAMWKSSANMFLGDNVAAGKGYFGADTVTGTTIGNFVKLPLHNKWGNAFTCDRVRVSLCVSTSAITASDIQDIKIYFNEIPE